MIVTRPLFKQSSSLPAGEIFQSPLKPEVVRAFLRGQPAKPAIAPLHCLINVAGLSPFKIGRQSSIKGNAAKKDWISHSYFDLEGQGGVIRVVCGYGALYISVVVWGPLCLHDRIFLIWCD